MRTMPLNDLACAATHAARPWRGLSIGLALVLAGCGGANDDTTERMAREHAQDTPSATPAATPPAAGTTVGERVGYGADAGIAADGYLARPAEGEPRAGLIVIHEWWGLNDNIRAMTERLAAEGYLALAVDLYGGQVAEEREGAQTLMRAAMADRAAGEANLRAAHAYLDARVERVGVIGWCFGGGWSLSTSLTLSDQIDAAVMYYGRVVTEPEALDALAAPLLGHFASEDRGIPLDQVQAMEAALAELGKDATVHVYEGADHAFANPSGTRYDAEAAELAWERTTAFFAEHLQGG